MEWCRSECGKYKIESLTASTIHGALKVMKESFFKDGIGALLSGVNEDPVAVEELLDLFADAALDGVSVAAVEIATGEVVAVAFNTLLVAPKVSTEKPFSDTFAERCIRESSKAFLEYLAKTDDLCNFFEIYGVDCAMKLWFLATLRDHQHKKIGFLLIKSSLELAMKLKDGPVSHFTVTDLGPKYGHIKPRSVTTMVPAINYGITSSIASQKIAKALGFIVHKRDTLSNILNKGKNNFETFKFEANYEAFAFPLISMPASIQDVKHKL